MSNDLEQRISRLRDAVAAARRTTSAEVPEALRTLVDCLDDVDAVVEACEALAARAAESDAQLERVLDHLHVVEIAMSSVSEVRDDASTALDEARRAAGVPVGASLRTGLRDRIRELIEERDRALASSEERHALLAEALDRLDGGAAPESSELIERLRAAVGRA